MQLTLAILDPPQSLTAPDLVPVPWDRLDEVSRIAALEILARLIAQMLAARSTTEASNE
jgi:hypothetical protein